MIVFGLALVFIVILRLLIGFVSIPHDEVATISIVVSVLFIAVPVLGFYQGGSYAWTWKQSLALLIIGAGSQALFGLLVQHASSRFVAGVLMAISQTGLLLWCFGLGALLATILRDKNLLLPVAIFLALFDIWLVFAPEGVAGQAARNLRPAAAEVLKNLAYQVPMPVEQSAGGFARPMAYVGPADWLFLSMFFVALFRFRMRTRATFLAMIPTLAAYLLVVLLFGDQEIGPFRLGALPALLPIGGVILLVNWREFKLNKDEKVATVAVLVIGIAVVTWRMVVSLNAPEPPVEPLNSGPAQEAPESAPSLGPLRQT